MPLCRKVAAHGGKRTSTGKGDAHRCRAEEPAAIPVYYFGGLVVFMGISNPDLNVAAYPFNARLHPIPV